MALDASGAAAAYRRKSVLLTLDVGNTNVTAGVFDGDELKATWRTATDRSRTPDEYGLALSQLLPLKGVPANSVTDVCLCSVVPPLTSSFVELCKQYFDADPLTVDAGVKTGVRVLYDSPRDVGPDRIADAVAALHLYGGPAIVVDFGTATVFDAVSAKGEYLGGAIAPGIALATDALYANTSLLRRVQLSAPNSAIGKSTVHSLQSGIVLGYTDLVTGMVKRFRAELGEDCRVIGTGGLATLFDNAGIFDTIDLNLTLIGLKLIYGMNRDCN